jgi:curved DNA-binding protein CbpA
VNYYDLLNITCEANSVEIKRAYFSAVKLHSPDSDPEGFKAIRIAYETLICQKKRAEYDSFFVASGGGAISADIQNDLLAVRDLIRENKYYLASEFLTGLSGRNPDSTEVKRLLAEVLWQMKKSGTAEKLCAELLEKDPADCDTLLLRAKIAVSMGKTEKAGSYFSDAANAAPLNAKVWIEYMFYALKHSASRIPGIFQRAMEQDKDMFRDEYILYLVGVKKLDLFTGENYLQYYDKFADFYINDENPDEHIFEQVMDLMPCFLDKDELVPFVEKILPTLEKSKHRIDDDGKSFRYIRAAVVIHKLHKDKRIHDVLVDLTSSLLMGDEDKNELLSMECYIVSELSVLRPSIKVLKNEYPEYFKLNQSFYLDVLNKKKEDRLIDKYAHVFRKLKPKTKNEPDFLKISGYMDDDDYDETDESKPFVHESPKVGRNDPCPCGSGKKFKKCCGRN